MVDKQLQIYTKLTLSCNSTFLLSCALITKVVLNSCVVGLRLKLTENILCERILDIYWGISLISNEKSFKTEFSNKTVMNRKNLF